METIPLPPDISDEGEGVKQMESKIDLRIFLEGLSARTKRVLELKLAGYNIPEISKILAISQSTAIRDIEEAKKAIKNPPHKRGGKK